MTKWEYAYVRVEVDEKATGSWTDPDDTVLLDALNKRGQEGWEVCDIKQNSLHEKLYFCILMKRPI